MDLLRLSRFEKCFCYLRLLGIWIATKDMGISDTSEIDQLNTDYNDINESKNKNKHDKSINYKSLR
jgi:hypothetical protein